MEDKDTEKSKTKYQLRKFIEFDFNITRDKIPKIIPFILFLTFLMLAYIANKNYSEKCILQMNKLNKELKDYRAESLTIKTDLMNKTKQSEVEKLAEPLGLKSLTRPPKKILSE